MFCFLCVSELIFFSFSSSSPPSSSFSFLYILTSAGTHEFHAIYWRTSLIEIYAPVHPQFSNSIRSYICRHDYSFVSPPLLCRSTFSVFFSNTIQSYIKYLVKHERWDLHEFVRCTHRKLFPELFLSWVRAIIEYLIDAIWTLRLE